MDRKNIVRYSIVTFLLILSIFFYFRSSQKENLGEVTENKKSENLISANIIKNVNYESEDAKGNIYIIDASEGEIDKTNSDIIFLTDVRGLIKLKDSDDINITSNFGKYNINNYDTIFTKNVIIDYLDNKITGNYLDFSIERNSMIISKDVIYTNTENILKTDVVEIDIKTKDTKIFMLEDKKKVNIKSKN